MHELFGGLVLLAGRAGGEEVIEGGDGLLIGAAGAEVEAGGFEQGGAGGDVDVQRGQGEGTGWGSAVDGERDLAGGPTMVIVKGNYHSVF